MRIALLGAAGFVGRAAAAALAAHPAVRGLLLVDYDVRAVKKFAKSLSAGCRWAMADAGRAPDLERLLPEVDAVASAVGPCSEYEKTILLSCAARKRPAASIGDGPLEARDRGEIHDAFRRAGIAAVSGCGLMPGWTELLAAHFMPRSQKASLPTRRFLFWSPDRFGGYAFFRRMARERGPCVPSPARAPAGGYREGGQGDLIGIPGGGALRRAVERIGSLGTAGLEFQAALLFWLRRRLQAGALGPTAAAGVVLGEPGEPSAFALVEDPEGKLPGLLLAHSAVRLAAAPGERTGLVPLPEIVGREEAKRLAEEAGAKIGAG